MESEVKGDEEYPAYTTSEMPTYTSAQYSGDIHGYYQSTDFDWQNGTVDSTRSMYSIAPRPDTTSQLQYYSSYQPVAHPELYPSQVLWTGGTIHLAGSNTITHATSGRRETKTSSTNSNGRPKRRRTQSVVQRRAANVRERRRMFQLNEAFDALRKKLPAFNYEKRLSRIETLRLAMTYISFMQEVTTGADPKHVKLLSYHSDESNHKYDMSLQSDGYHSPELHDNMDMVRHEENIGEPPTLIDASVHLNMIPNSSIEPVTPEGNGLSSPTYHIISSPSDQIMSGSAVHVEMLPTQPPSLTLPVTDQVILTEEAEEDEVDEEDREIVEAAQHVENLPSN